MTGNLLLTSKSGIGKTTIIKKIVDKLPNVKATGFYTSEIRTQNVRKGFKATTLDGKEITLAHVDIGSSCRVGKYGVAIRDFESLIVPSIDPYSTDADIITIDEIGKMECFSKTFKQIVKKALDSERFVIGTIAMRGDDFIRLIKSRKNVEVIEVRKENRNILPGILLKRIFNRT